MNEKLSSIGSGFKITDLDNFSKNWMEPESWDLK